MRMIFLFLALVLLCISCTPAAYQHGPRPAVSVPDKEQSIEQESDEQPRQSKAEAQDKTASINQRLQEIISESSIPGQAEIFASSEQQSGQAKEVSFNFHDAELAQVVKVFMQVLEEDYVLHPEVQGRVSLSVQDEFYPEQILDILRGVLRTNQVTLIRGQGLWEVLPQELAPRHLGPGELVFPKQTEKPRRGQIIQAYRLRFIPAAEMVNILEPYLSSQAQIYAHEPQGVLLLSDYPHILEKASELIRQFDVSVFADIQARIFQLKFIAAQEAAQQLESIAESFGLGAEKAGPARMISFLALERLNMVLAVSRDSQVMEFAKTWVQGLDQELPRELQAAHSEDIFVYYLQFGDAQEIISSLQGIFMSDSRQDSQDSGRQEGQDSDNTEQAGAGADQVQAQLVSQVQFNMDSTTNSIITRCNTRDYDKVLAVIEKLDLYPKQVLIEVIIAEVTLKDTTRLGVDWRYLLSFGDSLDGKIEARAGADTPETGITFSLASSNRLQAALDAAVEDSELQILSTPTLLASDNKPARINIGDQVPFPTSTRTKLDDTDTSEVIDTTIQYRDTGIILEVTPKINKQGMVRMELQQEVSNLSTERVKGIDAPVINTRHTSTSLAVGDQETVVIAGLMTQKRNKSSSSVPGFNMLPGVRHLFGSSRNEFENTELLVFITPHVILSQEDSSFLTRNFLQRLEQVREQMQ